jgi:ABC-type transport system substrate-binding protein
MRLLRPGREATSTADDGLPSTVTIEADGDPTAGGELVYGVEAESDGWNPTKTRWATSGTLVGATLFDTLAAFDDNGRVVPYLAEEITPNGNFTEWTVVLRDGVTFPTGSPSRARP